MTPRLAAATAAIVAAVWAQHVPLFKVRTSVPCSGSGPTICSASGTVSNGNSVTLTGVHFGTGGAPSIYDNFERSANGTDVPTGAATVGSWTNNAGVAGMATFSTTTSISGTRSLHIDGSGSNQIGGMGYINSTDENDVYASWWVKLVNDFPGDNNADGRNWKMTWLQGPDTSHNDLVLPRSLGDGGSVPIADWRSECNVCAASAIGDFSPTWSMAKNIWYRIEFFVHGATTSTGSITIWVSSPSTEGNLARAVYYNKTNIATYASAPGAGGYTKYKEWDVVGYARQNLGRASDEYFDDVYATFGANARAHVEICDASTLAAAKTCSVQTVTSWSDTSIAFTVRAGNLGTLSGKYLYAVDGSGNVSAGLVVP